MSKKPSLAPKPTEEATPAADAEPKPVPEGPEVDKIVNGTKEAEARKKADQDAAEAERKRKEEDAALARLARINFLRDELAWCQPGVHNLPSQANIQLPNKVKMKLNYLLNNKHKFPMLDSKASMSSLIAGAIEEWVNARLVEADIPTE